MCKEMLLNSIFFIRNFLGEKMKNKRRQENGQT